MKKYLTLVENIEEEMTSEILLENVSIQRFNLRTIGRRGKGVGIYDNLVGA